jgi:hypothetical protein
MTREQFTTLIATIETGGKNTAAEMRNVLNAFKDGIALTGDIKAIHCDAAYIALNFDNTGLGRLEREGWAICNGINTTPPIGGRTIVGYGDDYEIGFTGGSKNTVLPEHFHNNGVADGQMTLFVYGSTTTDMPGSATSGIDNFGELRSYQGKTSVVGESGVGKNMQPFIVLLYIKKL